MLVYYLLTHLPCEITYVMGFAGLLGMVGFALVTQEEGHAPQCPSTAGLTFVWLVGWLVGGRSVWNSRWKIVIPAITVLKDEQTGLNNFTATVNDIKLFLRTYLNVGS